MLAVCSEVTQQVLGGRRMRLLRDLAEAGETQSVEKTCQDVAAVLAEDPLDVPFALLYLRDQAGKLTLCGAAGLQKGEPASPYTIEPESDEGAVWPSARVVEGETVLVEGVERHVTVPGGSWGEPVCSALAMPIASSGQAAPLGMLVAGVSPPDCGAASAGNTYRPHLQALRQHARGCGPAVRAVPSKR